jgi:outer membrane protein assembly factor BamC
MNTKFSSLFIVAVLINISACSTIKTWFPDKGKDYQFTTEIPALILPADLAGESIEKASVKAETHAAPVIETAPSIDRKSIQLELINADQGTKRLRIGASTAISWRMVGKALSRKSIEVTDRNQEQVIFHVQYDPNKQPVEDDSIWDEITFFIKGFGITEQEYVVKIVQNNLPENKQQSDVIILDKEQKLATDETSLKLLMLLHDTIKADLPK